MKHGIRLYLLSGALVAVLAWGQPAEAGFGVSPPLIREDRLVPGITLERVIYLVQGAPTRDLPVELFVDSSVAEWFSFPQGNPIVIPAGVQQFPLAVEIAVPDTADLGVYKGSIRLTTVPEKATESGEVAIAIGGVVALDLVVGDDVIYDLSVKTIKILDTKEGDDPEAEVTLLNSGNVSASADSATFELFNKFGEIRLAYSEAPFTKKVPAFGEGTERLSFPVEVYTAPGEYWGHVKVYKDRELIGELRTVFNVTEKTPFEKYRVWVYVAAVFAFLILIIGILLASALRRGTSRNTRSR